MANELSIALDPTYQTGLTLVTEVFNNAGVKAITDVVMTEVGVIAFYNGSLDFGVLSDGSYLLRTLDTVANNIVGVDSVEVSGGVLVDLSSKATTTDVSVLATEENATLNKNTVVDRVIVNKTKILELNDFDPTSDAVANVTLVTTTTTNADMVDISLVATEANATSNKNAVDAKIDTLNDFNPIVDVVARVTLVDTTTTNTDMKGTDGGAKPSHIAPLY